MQPEEFVEKQTAPFVLKEFVTKTQLSAEAAKVFLKKMVAEWKLGYRKIGRMNVYWPHKREKPSKVKPAKRAPTLTFDRTRLQDQILALEEERDLLLAENQRLKHEFERFQARFANEEDVWREIAERMAASLAEMRGVTIKEVLKYFGAPHY
ncbi:MAG: hypothetical protein ACE5R6_01370 [Candidatus Heimdallarchaeota archaeon]